MYTSLQGTHAAVVHTVVEECFKVGKDCGPPVVVLGVVIRGETNNVP